MKTKLLALLLVALCFSCIKLSKVIDNPVIEKKGTTAMEIYQVRILNSKTQLQAELYGRPDNWVRIDSGAYLEGVTTGKKYKLISSDNFELGKEVYLPKSGNCPATLNFEPIDRTEEAINFIEGDADGYFRLEGIQLHKKSTESGSFVCVIEGEVIDRPQSSRLILMPKGKDSRIYPFISIPIRNGKFRYELRTSVNEAYELTFWDEELNGSWRPIPFIAERGSNRFKLYPMEHIPHFAFEWATDLNYEEIRRREEVDSLFSTKSLSEERIKMDQEERFYSKERYALRKKIEAASTDDERRKLFPQYDQLRESGKEYSAEGAALAEKFERLSKDRQQWLLDYIRNNTSINGLCLLKEQIDWVAAKNRHQPGEADMKPYAEVYKSEYKEKYSSHPYIEEIERVIGSLDVKAGNMYLDFLAQDLNGNKVKLSGQIGGKVALIDLWASWCGPCRRHSISMIPVYEAYKDKGFVVVGVARERGNTDAMKKAIEKDQYPWLNLVELNDAGNIWAMYGVGNGGGGTFLVDKDGKILAVGPTAEEVTKILAEKLP